MVQSQYNISMMFAIMDTNSDNKINFSEFFSKMRGMHIPVTQEESKAFFDVIDRNHSGTLDFNELVNEFSAVNNQQFVKKMKSILLSAKFEPEVLFNKHLNVYRTQERLSYAEFKNLLLEINQNLLSREIFHLQKHFDRGNKSHVTKADFLHVLQSEFVEKKIFDLSIEDVIKPMAFLARKYGKDLGELFGKIDSSNDGMISAEELADHVKRALGMVLRPEDI